MKVEMKRLLLFPLVTLLSSCALTDLSILPHSTQQPAKIGLLVNQDLLTVGIPEVKPVIAIYPNSFTDLTGQRRSSDNFATFSTAITQAPYVLLIGALNKTSNGQFFDVVERIGLDNLTRERQLIRSTRESFDQDQSLLPLKFAGLLIEGGVISYESNLRSGGTGARYLGIGSTSQYREDVVTVSLRLVSVSTGTILIDVLTTKTILSVAINQDLFRFVKDNTELVEIESGIAENESVNIALQNAVETAVLEIISIGETKGYWKIKL
jgi:curli production assembly/transport component CsgG